MSIKELSTVVVPVRDQDAAIAGSPPQFRVWDPDGNSLLIVAAVP